MMPQDGRQPPQVIIAGFGVPGRYIAELLDERFIPYTVIELNAETAERCTNVAMIVGDVRDEAVLRRAGNENASIFAITVPDEAAAVEAGRIARSLRPDLRILVRCVYTSSGLKAQQVGADEVIVAEQLVAKE